MQKVSDNAMSLMNRLYDSNIEAYFVGGCVRDLLLGDIPQDYDITVNCSPEKIINTFDNVIPTGLKHGTVTVVHNGEPFEITQMRADGEYIDHRHPEIVTPTTSISEDLKRRDFTINAMAMDKNYRIIDLFGGKKDLENKKIVCVGDAKTRYNEDALRILRCFRFASRLSFEIEENTFNSAIELSHLLPSISAERIYNELTKLLLGKKPSIIKPLLDIGALSYLGLSEAENLSIIDSYPDDLVIRLFLFILNSGGKFEEVLSNLKAPNKIKIQVFWCSHNYNKLSNDKITIKNILGTCDDVDLLYKLNQVFGNSDIKTKIEEIIDNNEPYKISQLAINGDDLQNIGISGKNISCYLNKALKYVIETPDNNTREFLLNLGDK